MVKLVCRRIARRLCCDHLLLRAGQLGPQRVGNRFRNVALNFENVGQLAIVNLGPEMRAGECVDQLHIDPHLIVCSLHAAFEDVSDAELLCDVR